MNKATKHSKRASNLDANRAYKRAMQSLNATNRAQRRNASLMLDSIREFELIAVGAAGYPSV